MRNRTKQMPNKRYFPLAKQLVKCMIINPRGLVITHKMSTQKISNSKTSTQKIPDLHVCYTDKIESNSVNANTCSTDEMK